MTRSMDSTTRLCLSGVLLVALVASGLVMPACGDPIPPSAKDRQVTLTVIGLLHRDHLSEHKVDDEISQRCLKRLLKTLDPMKLYFYQSDIDGFMSKRNELDDMARRGDITFAYEVFRILLARIDERVKIVDELLAMEHDFSVDEKMVIDRDEAHYARNPAEAREKWRKRIKYDLLDLKADKSESKEGKEAVEKLRRRYRFFARRMHQTDSEEVLETYLTSLTMAFDPHTTYMSPSTLKNFTIVMRLGLEGIGASLQAVDGYTVVHKIIRGGAAHKDDRLKAKDKIIGVGQGTEGPIVNVEQMKLKDVVKLIRGKPDTVVRLEVISKDSDEPKIIQITRAKIELKDDEAQSRIFPTEACKPNGQPYKIGVIDLRSFYMDMDGARRGIPDFRSTTRDVRRILEDFTAKAVDAVILDLRHNGGGSLTEAINTTGLFIDQGPVVQVKGSDGRVQSYNDLELGMVWKGPLVVLVSKFSASASEILAGAIQDYDRGLIVGDRATHGKGTVQSLMDVGQQLMRVPGAPKLGALKVTMQQFYRPNGESTQNRGVLADIELPSVTTHLDVGEADLDYAMAWNRIEPQTFKKLGRIDDAVRDRLRALSAERVRKSEEFQKRIERIARYKQRKDQKVITLEEKAFMAQRAETNVDKEQQKKLDELNDPDRSIIERDYYLNEAMAISLDYLQLMLVAQTN